MTKEKVLKIAFIVLLIAVLHPHISSAMALFAGLAFALILGNPFHEESRKYTKPLLAGSIVAVGAGTDLAVVARAGLDGVVWTACALAATLSAGYLLGKLLKTGSHLSALVNVGTAVCGGSAIAAISPAIRANDEDISISLIIVFVLNGLGLFIFPPMGHALGLNPEQFGMWAAVAIHDTSSVIGAAIAYDPASVPIATTVKLTRALWIIPLTFLFAWIYNRGGQGGGKKAPFPMFILGFLAMSAFVTFIPALHEAGEWVEFAGHRALVLTLFLIGAGLSRENLKNLSARPLIQAVILWILAASGNLLVVMNR